MQFGIGFLLALAITSAARALRTLSHSGWIAALGLGTAVYGFGDWRSAIILLAFFVSATALGRLFQPQGRRTEDAYAKGGQRDAGQVLGNGVVAGAVAVLAHYNPGAPWLWAGFAGAIAAVNADTWATELGALSSAGPRLITNLKRRVPPGTSGGVSWEGTLAAFVGSLLIATLATLLWPAEGADIILAVWTGGIAGALADSYLGATVQAMYRCTSEQTETEQHPLHRCGSRTERVRGWSWLNNDGVNFACSMIGALTACGIAGFAGVA